MYKTIWSIYHNDIETKLTTYHFGKTPKFPSWYMEEGIFYTIKMRWNVKIVNTFSAFFKCLFHFYTIQ